MIIDRYTKAILTLIAVGLFVVSLNPWIAPTKAYAEMGWGHTKALQGALHNIADAINSIDCRR